MTFDRLFGRLYFWPGVGLAIYGVLVLAFKLPTLLPESMSTMLAGVVLMLIGSNILAKVSNRKPEASISKEIPK